MRHDQRYTSCIYSIELIDAADPEGNLVAVVPDWIRRDQTWEIAKIIKDDESTNDDHCYYCNEWAYR